MRKVKAVVFCKLDIEHFAQARDARAVPITQAAAVGGAEKTSAQLSQPRSGVHRRWTRWTPPGPVHRMFRRPPA
jgi:hypothetical protein